MKKGISVIICCYNSATRLPKVIEHLSAQRNTDHIPHELIVVDNSSTDDTSGTAKSLCERLIQFPFKVVREPRPGLAHARARGISEAQYEYLLFCDDDNWLSETYLNILFSEFENNRNLGVLGGIGMPAFEGEKPEWFDTHQENFACGKPSLVNGKLKYVYGAGMGLRQSTVRELRQKGFTEILSDRKGNTLYSGGDNELCHAAGWLGYEIALNTSLTFLHYMPKNRINKTYLEKLHDGFGRSRLYLEIYTYFDTQNELPGKNLRLPFWLDVYLHKRKLFKNMERGLSKIAMNAEMDERWKLKWKIMDLYKHVQSFKNNVHST